MKTVLAVLAMLVFAVPVYGQEILAVEDCSYWEVERGDISGKTVVACYEVEVSLTSRFVRAYFEDKDGTFGYTTVEATNFDFPDGERRIARVVGFVNRPEDFDGMRYVVPYPRAQTWTVITHMWTMDEIEEEITSKPLVFTHIFHFRQ